MVFMNRLGRHVPSRLNKEYFHSRWSQLLVHVKTPEGMILAVIDADKLLDEALKKRRYKGKTMGERLVAAQRSLTNNDAVWFAHKLRNRLVHEPGASVNKKDVQRALEGFKQALKDLGAL
jgi:hypothetical protein